MYKILLSTLLLSFSFTAFAEGMMIPTTVPSTTPNYQVSSESTNVNIPNLAEYTLFGVASPAAVKCFQDGGTLRGTRGVDGSPVAYCVFNKPFQIIEEWAYFRGEVKRFSK